MRRAGATARTMVVAAAAKRWNVDPASCRAERGTVIHTPSHRRLSYGALAAAAAALPIPDNVVLKRPEDFKLIGTPAKRLDTPDKVNGRAQFGIDVRLPGMKIATVAASPVLGGTVAGLDEAKAMAIAGVRQIVKLDDVVAVVADHMWAAKQGLAALSIRWDDGPNAKVSTADVVQELDAASQQPGVVARKEGDAAVAIAGAAGELEAGDQAPLPPPPTMEAVNCTAARPPPRREGGAGRAGQADCVDPPPGGPVDPGALGATGVPERARRRCVGRGGASAVRHPRDPGRVRAPRGARLEHRLLARRRRDAQHVRDRELHRRARRGREAGSRRVSPRAPRQVAAGQGGAGPRGAGGRVGPAAPRPPRSRRCADVQWVGYLCGPGRRGCRLGRGRRARAADRVRRRLRHRREPGYREGADRGWGGVRHRWCAVGRDHAQERPGRAVQFQQLPDAADERNASDRGAPRAQPRAARRDRRARHGGHGPGAGQRDLRGHRKTDPPAAPGSRSQDVTETMRRSGGYIATRKTRLRNLELE